MKLIAFLVLLTTASFGADIERKSINAVFVTGNNEAASKIRKEMGKGKTCLLLATNKERADAVLDVAEDYDKNVSGTLTSSGELIWSRTEGYPSVLLLKLTREFCKK